MAAVVPTTQTQIIVAVQERKLYGIPIGKLQYLKTSFMDILWMYGTHMLLNPFDRLKTIKQTKMHLTSLNVPVSESAISNCLSRVSVIRFDEERRTLGFIQGYCSSLHRQCRQTGGSDASISEF
jgi:hypothetical protein